jgi:hypothetical protein
MTNVIDIREPAKIDALRNFAFDTEEDFRAISLLVAAIARLTTRDEDAPIWILAREIDDHLKCIQERLGDDGADNAA